MARGTVLLVGEGIQSGAPFVLNHLVWVSNVGPPPVVSTYGPQRLVDSLSAVEYTSVPNSAGVYLSNALNAMEPWRVNGGAIIQGSGTDSVEIGRNAVASATDTVVIGRGSVGSVPQNTVVGAFSNNNGQSATILGWGSGMLGCAGICIGQSTVLNGFAGGAGGILIGDNGISNCQAAGTVLGIGENVRACTSDVVIGNNASSAVDNPFGVGNVLIGEMAAANVAGGNVYNVAVGWSALSQQKLATVLGSGAQALTAGQTRTIVIGSGARSSATDAIVIGGGSVLTSKSIAIGAGAVELGAGFLQLGAPATPITTVLIGNGDTAITPANKTLRWTNASGVDNAAGSVTVIAPRSTGAAVPASIVFGVGQAGASSAVLQTQRNILTLSAPTLQVIVGDAGAPYGAGVASLRLNGLTSGAAAAVGTLNNAPVAGNPAFWMPVSIAGAVRYVPCW